MFKLTQKPIDPEALARGLEDGSCGAVVSFEGRVRDHNEGAAVVRLEYEAYPELAESEAAKVLAEAAEKFPIERVVASHRTGVLEIGDSAVWVGVAAAHRQDAFDACRHIIDEMKRRLPIWKRETFADGRVTWTGTPAGPDR